MAQIELLNRLIDEKGIKRSFIAKKLGITPQGLYKKLNGSSNFRGGEMRLMGRILDLDDHQMVEIFLPDELK